MQITIPRRLIERDVLHLEASMAGLKERYTRGETQQTIHVWWARRPHAAMRALTLFSLLREDSDASLSDGFSEEGVLKIRRLLQSTYGRKPKVLDPFGGGGTIPFEASYLGAEAHSIDSNAMAAFIQAANLNYGEEFRKAGVSELLKASGERALELLAASTAELFPLRGKTALCYIWSYRRKCDKCTHSFSVSKRPWLSKKKGKLIFYEITENGSIIHRAGAPKASNWAGRNGTLCCPHCGALNRVSLANTNDALCAIITSGKKTGKVFSVPDEDAIPSDIYLKAFEEKVLNRLGNGLPETIIPKWSGIINPSVYGMETHAEHFNKRQRCVMLALIEALLLIHKENEIKHGATKARAVTCALSGLIDQTVDWNSRLSMWIPQNEQVGRGLCGPGIAMLWDYAETDPVSDGPSNLRSKLNRICKGADALAELPLKVNTSLASAMALPYGSESFDAVITDPPYYDNVFYSPLADFIYTWKRMLLRNIVPQFFMEDLTDGEAELVSSSLRAGSSDKAHARYCMMFTKAFREASRVLRRDGIFSLVYSHSSVKGWCALVEAFQKSDFTVQSAQPLAIERKARPRAMTSAAVNTCIVFVAHLNGQKEIISHDDALLTIRTELHRPYLDELKVLGWTDADAGVAMLARLITPLCNVNFSGHDLEKLLIYAGKLVSELCPGFALVNRRSL